MNRLASKDELTVLLLFRAARPVRIEDDRRVELELVASPRDWVRTVERTLRFKACRLRLFMKLIFAPCCRWMRCVVVMK